MMSEQRNDVTHDDLPEDDQGRLSFTQTLVSVMRASFGVQNKKNKVRDFQRGSPAAFFVAALLFTTVFVSVLLAIVIMVT